MSETIEIKLNNADAKIDNLRSGQLNKLSVQSNLQVTVIEMEDINFHFDSAVLLPDFGAQEPQPGTEEQNRITGLGVLFACYKQAEEKEFLQKLLVAGHTDKKGGEFYNLTLSQKRAENVFFMLMGERTKWAESSHDKHQVEDTQQILKWISFNFRYDCDPGEKTNKMNAETTGAILAFQKRYNEDFVLLEKHKEKFSRLFTKIDEDGKMGKQTWKAFFDMYTLELLIIMGITEDGLNELRTKLNFIKKNQSHPAPVIGCGENHPASEAKTEDENAVDRRVEILFFDEGEEPELKCHPKKFQCIKSKCDLYPKGFFKRTPVPVAPLPLPSGVAVRVHLKFVYKTPEGNERALPKGFPYTLRFQDNTTEDKTIENDNGQIFLQVLREKKTFTIEFKFTETNFIASPEDDTQKDELVKEAGVKEKIKNNFKVFNLPLQFKLKTSVWELSPTVSNFDSTEKQFNDLDNLSVENIGSEASPIKMILDPKWQFLKFLYFDRWIKTKQSLLPFVLDGFNSASDTAPATRSNWLTTTEGCQCLPWIIQESPKPDSNTFLKFRSAENTFIETSGTASNFSRRYVTKNPPASSDPGLTEGGTINRDFSKAETNRLAYYDIPVLWKSKKYFTQLSGGTGNPPSRVGKFEDLVTETTTDDKPLIFSLDDLILTDKKLNPINWIPDNKILNRAAIFCNTFSRSGPNSDDLSSEGLYKPDGTAFINSTTKKSFTGNKLGFFTQMPKDEKDRNYISDYPDWTRLIVTQGNFFDAFDKRTVEGKGDVIGARAAVRIQDVFASPTTFVKPRINRPRVPAPAKSDFCEVQAMFEQDHVIYSHIGRFDMVRLRCTDLDTDGVTEHCVCIVYLRLFFNFNSTIDPTFNPNATPLNLTGNTAKDWKETAVLNLLHRWNGPDILAGTSPRTMNPGSALVLPANTADKKFKVKVIWFSQDLPKDISHYEVGVFQDPTDPGGVRGFMASGRGEGVLDQTDNVPNNASSGWFTFAHEAGHGGSLVDEYIESTGPGGIPGFDSNSPGSPFSIDSQSMMRSNREVRARHYWYIAEWFRQLEEKAIEYKIKHGIYEYFIQHHSDEPKKNFIGWPLAEKNNQELGDHGKFNIFFYPLGKEVYTDRVLPALAKKPGIFDGIIIVLVKIEFDFPIDDSAKIQNYITNINSRIAKKFNNKFGVKGNLAGKKFERALLHFAPRYYADDYSTTDPSDSSEHINVEIKTTGRPEWDSGIFSSKYKLFYPMDVTTTFANFFGNMVGLADNTLNDTASYEPIAKKVIPDAAVFTL